MTMTGRAPKTSLQIPHLEAGCRPPCTRPGASKEIEPPSSVSISRARCPVRFERLPRVDTALGGPGTGGRDKCRPVLRGMESPAGQTWDIPAAGKAPASQPAGTGG